MAAAATSTRSGSGGAAVALAGAVLEVRAALVLDGAQELGMLAVLAVGRAGEPHARGRRARAGRGWRVTREARRWSSKRTNSAGAVGGSPIAAAAALAFRCGPACAARWLAATSPRSCTSPARRLDPVPWRWRCGSPIAELVAAPLDLDVLAALVAIALVAAVSFPAGGKNSRAPGGPASGRIPPPPSPGSPGWFLPGFSGARRRNDRAPPPPCRRARQRGCRQRPRRSPPIAGRPGRVTWCGALSPVRPVAGRRVRRAPG
jgi:hypothetical protein